MSRLVFASKVTSICPEADGSSPMGLSALLFFPFHIGYHFPKKNISPVGVSVFCLKMADGRVMDLFWGHCREQVFDLASEDAFARLPHDDPEEN